MFKLTEEMNKEELLQALKQEKSFCETFHMQNLELRKKIKQLNEYINHLENKGVAKWKRM